MTSSKHTLWDCAFSQSTLHLCFFVHCCINCIASIEAHAARNISQRSSWQSVETKMDQQIRHSFFDPCCELKVWLILNAMPGHNCTYYSSQASNHWNRQYACNPSNDLKPQYQGTTICLSHLTPLDLWKALKWKCSVPSSFSCPRPHQE